jgi:hypothetical protein
MPTETPAQIQARFHAQIAQIQARLDAASQTWNQSRPGLLVQQYRDSEFHGRTRRAVAVRFRIPVATDPRPAQRRIALVSAWSGTLGLAGTVMALPVLADLFSTDSSWYSALMILIGMFGVGATAGAFASIHRRRAPWIGLAIGTIALGLAMLVTALR